MQWSHQFHKLDIFYGLLSCILLYFAFILRQFDLDKKYGEKQYQMNKVLILGTVLQIGWLLHQRFLKKFSTKIITFCENRLKKIDVIMIKCFNGEEKNIHFSYSFLYNNPTTQLRFNLFSKPLK